MSENIQFGYFNFGGRGLISRLLLAYTKTIYKDTKYSFSQINNWISNDKQSLGLDFPSLPYLIDGSFKLTQSRAIQKYIIYRAKKTDLLGKNNKQKAKIDNIDGVLRDIFNSLSQLFTASEIQESRRKAFKAASIKLSYIDSSIGSNKFLLNRLTYPDFVLASTFEYVKLFFPFQYKQWKNIERVAGNVKQLSQIQNYYNNPLSIINLIAPEFQTSNRFTNFKPLDEDKGLITQQLKKQEQKISNATNQLEQKVQMYQSVVQSHEVLPEKLIQDKNNNNPDQKKHFNNRVEQYIKAAKASNLKGTSSNNTQSNIHIKAANTMLEHIKQNNPNNSAPWKIQQKPISSQQEQISDKICLGYWGIRGLGQVQRHLLQYCNQEFTQKIYSTQAEWFNGDKLNLSLPFPNLPYLIEGQLKLTQSLAIDRYIIRKSQKIQLLGVNLKDETYIQNLVKILSDLFKEIRVLCFTADNQGKQVQKFSQKVVLIFDKISAFVGQKNYSLGYLTWVDFYISQISYYIEKIFPDIYTKYVFLRNIRQSISSNDGIQRYYTKNNSIKGPFMPPSAKICF